MGGWVPGCLKQRIDCLGGSSAQTVTNNRPPAGSSRSRIAFEASEDTSWPALVTGISIVKSCLEAATQSANMLYLSTTGGKQCRHIWNLTSLWRFSIALHLHWIL